MIRGLQLVFDDDLGAVVGSPDRPFLLEVAKTAIVFTLVAPRHLIQILIVAGHERVW